MSPSNCEDPHGLLFRHGISSPVITGNVKPANVKPSCTEADGTVGNATIHPRRGQTCEQENLAPQTSLQCAPLLLFNIRVRGVLRHLVYQRMVLGAAALPAVLGSLHSPGNFRLPPTSLRIV